MIDISQTLFWVILLQIEPIPLQCNGNLGWCGVTSIKNQKEIPAGMAGMESETEIWLEPGYGRKPRDQTIASHQVINVGDQHI